MLDVIYDMETADPDDAFTLCFLAGHPKVNLRGVTITPGSKDQIAIVKHLLKLLNKSDVLVGGRNPEHPKTCVSEFHYKWLGKIEPSTDNHLAFEILYQTLHQYPDCILLTGAALTNLKLLFNNYPNTKIKRWVGQGGFAGDNVVDIEHRLEKFVGKITCPTFNFNGDPTAAKLLLSSSNIETRDLVSKNVCHGVVYNQEMQEKVKSYRNNNVGIYMIYDGMSTYLKRHSSGKMFHDPLAACVLFNREVCTFKEVEIYREKGEWGSVLKENTNTFISVSVDHEKFFKTLVNIE